MRGHYSTVKNFIEKSIFMLHTFFMHALIFLDFLLKIGSLFSIQKKVDNP